ncbi:GH92 family glycosyl hydrolase [Pinibacter soli]|uniref:GH92 family glycosyl hydrolase n=1 Tax=Pinibacter soli TaxID=3044211 RepID=A0ABT6RFM0_9BACT|nr:GH92 family glycosyl hydrolase [Pinibacter soli]MDI3321340.1 GH92 family glycosyl hydrolase [Pinibacter soli]
MNFSHSKKILLQVICLCFAMQGKINAQQLISYVDPFIGTGGHGHTYPGATVPFGMVQLSPDNGTSGWDWCSGYNYSDTVIAGFSHMHLSGTGIGDWADISVLPLTQMVSGKEAMYKIGFSHANEKATPGFYSVKLNNGVQVSLTATERCGLHKYIFPKGDVAVIRFDLGFRINGDHPTDTYIRQVNDSTIVGYRFSSGWARVQRVFFAARTSAPIKKIEATNTSDKVAKAQLIFDGGKTILMKVGLSSVDEQSALQALNEITDWNFENVSKNAAAKWEKELRKVKIETGDEHLKRIFYTAFYHTCLAPVLYSDADGSYKNVQGNVTKMASGQRYTVYSLWDTFRALNPLMSVTQPDRYGDILNTMLAFYDENGLLPVWDLNTFETNTMTGYHAIPVLADAVLKNWPGIDAERVYKAMQKSAYQSIRGIPDYIKYGFLPQDKEASSASITLEYAYDDWCIAQVALRLGKKDDYNLFMKRSQSYINLFDKSTGFIRAKKSDGQFVTPFDPYYSEHNGRRAAYTEGNAWQHSFFVPQDIRGLAKLHGGNDKLGQKLDSLFSVTSSVTGENASADISGMIGQYAHGNEPSHHIAYMYDFIGQPWKTQNIVRLIMDSLYHDAPDGYSGNEDCGQMSAWAVWSILGLYPANPASGRYVFGSPLIDNAVITVKGNKQFTIKVKNNSRENKYIQSVVLNGKKYDKVYVDHADLMKGGTLEFTMGKEPNKKWGIEASQWP